MSKLWETPAIVPAVVYADVPAAVKWLSEAFGFRERPGSRLAAADWTLTWMEVGHGGLIHLTTGGHGLTPPTASGYASQSLKVYVDAIDSHFQHALSCGAEPVMELQDMFWGGRIYRARDIGGHVWEFSERNRELSADAWDLPPGATRS
ncbi:MAG: VOC family protein [Pseudomonadota bacterium]